MSDRAQSEHAAAAWIARRSDVSWSDADAAEFEAWLAESASHRAAWYRLSAAWRESGRLRALADHDAMPRRFGGRPRPAMLSRRVVFGMAASVLLAVGAGSLLQWQEERRGEAFTTVVGGLQTIPLEDGSTVTLNTDSQLHVRMDRSERRIELVRGEAYFQVAHDATRPFVVRAAGREITAVGTQFAVHDDGAAVHLAVLEGAVRMSAPGDTSVLRQPLGAGSVVHSTAAGAVLETLPAQELEQQLSWRSGLLVFRDTPLANAVEQFNRYNLRKIQVADAVVGDIRVGGVFRTTDLDAFLRLLETGFPVRIIAGPGQIMIHNP